MIYQRNDTNQNTLDAIAVQESYFGEYEYLQKEHGYICYFVNESLNRYHGTCIIIRDTYLQTNISHWLQIQLTLMKFLHVNALDSFDPKIMKFNLCEIEAKA